MYKANVRKILTEGEGDKVKAVGVQLADGRSFHGQVDIVPLLCLPQVCKFDFVFYVQRHIRISSRLMYKSAPKFSQFEVNSCMSDLLLDPIRGV